MILILSIRNDRITNNVIDWLIFSQVNFKRLNAEDQVKVLKIALNSSKAATIQLEDINKGDVILIENFKKIWYRTGKISLQPASVAYPEKAAAIAVNNYLKAEAKAITDFIITQLSDKPSLGSYTNSQLNKLFVLVKAKEVGLKIPDTLISSEKEIVASFNEKNGCIINKSIKDCFTLVLDNTSYFNPTSEINAELFQKMSHSFFPSLVQPRLDKAYELRIFFMKDLFYSMAIFSQNDSQTKVDYRRYNYTKPNRTVPYKLPDHIKGKIIHLMKVLDLDTGSVDMIVTKNGDYIFLEVNPVGQFGAVSSGCNYYIEKQIYEFLAC